MEVILKFLKEIMKGVVRETFAHLFKKKDFRTQEAHPIISPSEA
ncbi:hypothetical protein [Bacillus sp. H1a]|nr:hypothetical protein [Bacillus sp. H1a]